MAFCINCGSKLVDDAKFCANCGFAVSEKTTMGQRKTVYEGEDHKCPKCGETLKSFVSSCTSCGYEVRNRQENGSVKEFAEKIDSAENDEQRIRLIRNFAIPNTKEDILEFVILASTNICSGYVAEETAAAWMVKMEQCRHKADLLLLSDSNYGKIVDIYEKTKKKYKRIKRKKSTVATTKKENRICMMLIPKCFGLLCGLVSFAKAITMDTLVVGSGVGFELLGGFLLIASAATLGRKDSGYMEIIICAVCGVISFLMAKMLDNGAFLQIVGVIVCVIAAVKYFKKLGAKQK